MQTAGIYFALWICTHRSTFPGENQLAEDNGNDAIKTLTDDMHWALYLRTDIQDLRQDLRDLRLEVRESLVVLRGEIDRSNTRADTRFYWTIGIIVTLFGIQNGVIITLLKL